MIIPSLMLEAENMARRSQCTRRQYGVVIASGPVVSVLATNERVGRCCNGNICIRDLDNLQHVEAIERGAEIHAEASALIQMKGRPAGMQFYLAGFRKGRQLKGDQCRPCHYCVMMMIYAGFDNYIVKDENNSLVYVSTWKVMEDHEATYGGQLV